MDVELRRRIEDRKPDALFKYLDEMYCQDASLSGNFISLSKKTSFILSLRDLSCILFGNEEVSTIPSPRVIATCSADCFEFKGTEKGSEMIASTSITKAVHVVQHSQKSLADLVLSVMGLYPSSSYHLVSLLLEPTSTTIPLRVNFFPSNTIKQFMELFMTKQTNSKSISPSVKYPSDMPALYTQFLCHNPIPKTKENLEVSPFEYYIIRFLISLRDSRVNPLSTKLHHVNKTIFLPPTENTGILGIQLFIHYLNYLIHPNNPTQPTINMIRSAPPSLQRADMFFLNCISELWLRDEHVKNDWSSLYQESSRQSSYSMLPSTCVLTTCLYDLIQYLQQSDLLIKDGMSTHLAVIVSPLFYFLARQFTFYTQSDPDPYIKARLIDFVYCWKAYLQPWNVTKKSIHQYKHYIRRNYVFYRGLLILLLKRISVTNLKSDEILEIMNILFDIYNSEVLSELNDCDVYLQQYTIDSNQTFGNERINRNDLINEGFHILKITKIVPLYANMNGNEVHQLLLSRLCRCYVEDSSKLKKSAKLDEMTVVTKLAEILSFDKSEFAYNYETLKKSIKGTINSDSMSSYFIQPIKEFLFEYVATQNHITQPKLHDPIRKFEISWLVPILVQWTIYINTTLFLSLHALEERSQGMNWDEYFDETSNLYINLRWFADGRNLLWCWLFIMICKFVYWIGMQF